jgi:hypothetical protein
MNRTVTQTPSNSIIRDSPSAYQSIDRLVCDIAALALANSRSAGAL